MREGAPRLRRTFWIEGNGKQWLYNPKGLAGLTLRAFGQDINVDPHYQAYVDTVTPLQAQVAKGAVTEAAYTDAERTAWGAYPAAVAADAEVIYADAIALAQKESAAARARCLADGGCLIGSAAEAEYNRQVDSWQAIVDEAAVTADQMNDEAATRERKQFAIGPVIVTAPRPLPWWIVPLVGTVVVGGVWALSRGRG